MNKRLKLLRNKKNMSQSDFASKLGVTAAAISKIENGQRNLTDQMILLLCKEFHVNENWIRYGVGEMFLLKSPNYIDKLAQEYNLDELDKKIICEYSKLDEARRTAIKDYIVNLAYSFIDIEKDNLTNNDLESIVNYGHEIKRQSEKLNNIQPKIDIKNTK